MDRVYVALFEDVAQAMDTFVAETLQQVTDPSTDRRLGSDDVKPAYETLHRCVADDASRAALRAVLIDAIAGTLHSVMVMLEGGTQFSDEFEATLQTSDGRVLAPGHGLNELFFEHLYDTGRLPARM